MVAGPPPVDQKAGAALRSAAVQRPPQRLFAGRDLHRRLQGAVRAGAELLFLPRGRRGVPAGGAAKRAGRVRPPRGLVRAGDARAVRRRPRADGLRLALPDGARSGVAAQAAHAEDQEKQGHAGAVAAQVRDPYAVRRRRSPVLRAPQGPAPARLLQVHLPRRDAGGRAGAADPPEERGASGRAGRRVRPQGRHPRAHRRRMRLRLSRVLPLPVPAGGHLRAVQPLRARRRARGRQPLQRLRGVRQAL